MKKLSLVCLLIAAPVLTHADVLLTLNLTSASNVTITSNTSFPGNTSLTTTEAQGVELLGFFTSSNQLLNGVVNGNLTPNGASTSTTTPYLNWAASDTNLISYVDLNLFISNAGSQPVQNFVTFQPAFFGNSTTDMSLASSFLPAPGTTGDIRAGNAGITGPVIGTWVVAGPANPVPEPANAAIVTGLAAIGLRSWSKRKKLS